MKKLIRILVILFLLLLSACGAGNGRVSLHFEDGRVETVEVSSMDSLRTLLGRAYTRQSEDEGYAYVWFSADGKRLEELDGIPDEMFRRYAPVSVTVWLDARGGSAEPDRVQTVFGSPYGVLPEPERDGYRFEGWFTEEVGGRRITADSLCDAAEEQTLYAAWARCETYTLLLSPNGGEGEALRISAWCGLETVLPLSPFTKEGCAFAGWNTEPDGSGTAWPDGGAVTDLAPANGECTLYAVWSGDAVTVSLDPQGGELGAVSVQVMYGALYGELPEPQRDGYVFLGWAVDPDGKQLLESGAVVENAEPHTLYAVWSASGFTVSFDPNGGSGSMAPVSGEPGTGVSLPKNTFVREGYTFAGWAESQTGTALYADGTLFDADDFGSYTLYAVWTPASAPKQVTVTFNANGGSVRTSSAELESGAAYGPLPVPVREGYIFAGWYTAVSGGSPVTEGSVVTASDHTLYARWTAQEQSSSQSPAQPSDGKTGLHYTIQYNANGGSGSTGASQHVNGTPSALSSNGFTRDGYTFVGWSTQADGTGLFFTDGEQVDGLAIAEGDIITLYAVWE